jgi:hypothetical protein
MRRDDLYDLAAFAVVAEQGPMTQEIAHLFQRDDRHHVRRQTVAQHVRHIRVGGVTPVVSVVFIAVERFSFGR